MVQTAGPPTHQRNHLTNGDNTDTGDFVNRMPSTRRPERLAMEITVTAWLRKLHQDAPDFERYLSLHHHIQTTHARSQEHNR